MIKRKILFLLGLLHGVVFSEQYLRTPQVFTVATPIEKDIFLTNGAIIYPAVGEYVRCHTLGSIDGTINFPFPLQYPSSNRLELYSDLTLGSTATFSGNACIKGNHHSLRLTGSCVIRKEFAVIGDLTIDGGSNVVELADTGQFLLTYDNGITSTLRLKNMTLLVDDAITIAISSDSTPSRLGTLELENVDIVAGGDVASIASGNIFLTLRQLVRLLCRGQGLIELSITVPCVGISSGSVLYVGPGTNFAITDHGRTFFGCQDHTAMIYFDGCRVSPEMDYVSLLGWYLQRGTVIFDNNVTVNNYFFTQAGDFYNDNVSRGFVLGNDGVNEVKVFLTPSAQLDVWGCLVHEPL